MFLIVVIGWFKWLASVGGFLAALWAVLRSF
jgi:hypothetical protein